MHQIYLQIFAHTLETFWRRGVQQWVFSMDNLLDFVDIQNPSTHLDYFHVQRGADIKRSTTASGEVI